MKRNQLRELAALNGTLRDDENQTCINCGGVGHRRYECPERQNYTNALTCRICGGRGHTARDCLHRNDPEFMAQAQEREQHLDSEYMNLMAELGEKVPENGGAGGDRRQVCACGKYFRGSMLISCLYSLLVKRVHLGNVQQIQAAYHHGNNSVIKVQHLLHLHHQGRHLLLGQNKIMDHHQVAMHMDLLLEPIIKVMAVMAATADMVDIKVMINNHHRLLPHQVLHHG